MEIFRTVADFRAWSRGERAAGRTHGFVPTMGALHEGHASLLARARAETDSVSLSIFVNPTQFGPNEDFTRYPRTWESDLAMAEREGVKAIFSPESFYPEGYRTQIVLPKWNSVLEGEIRPGHFDGVTSVVAKLFHASECDVAVFGQKDAQQALLVRRMVRDLDFPLRLVVAPTVREDDGLALSSRNRYLSMQERRRCVALSRALRAAISLWVRGERSGRRLLEASRIILQANPPDSLDYLTLLDPDSLAVLDEHTVIESSAVLVIAGRYGSTRLIDNAVLGPVWD